MPKAIHASKPIGVVFSFPQLVMFVDYSSRKHFQDVTLRFMQKVSGKNIGIGTLEIPLEPKLPLEAPTNVLLDIGFNEWRSGVQVEVKKLNGLDMMYNTIEFGIIYAGKPPGKEIIKSLLDKWNRYPKRRILIGAE